MRDPDLTPCSGYIGKHQVALSPTDRLFLPEGLGISSMLRRDSISELDTLSGDIIPVTGRTVADKHSNDSEENDDADTETGWGNKIADTFWH